MKCGMSRWLAVPLAACVFANVAAEEFDDDDYHSKGWHEAEFQLPSPPSDGALLPFYVSASTENKFFVDGATLTVGSDGVVRYVLVVVSPQGAKNVTFEGMRCETKERRVYASGRADGSWSKAKESEWVAIRDAYANRHHSALYAEYFCNVAGPVKSSAEARNVLVKGGRQGLWY